MAITNMGDAEFYRENDGYYISAVFDKYGGGRLTVVKVLLDADEHNAEILAKNIVDLINT